MTSLIPSVTLVDGQPRVSSLDIAEKFGKPHKDVLNVIRRIVAELEPNFRERNFSPTFTNVPGPNGAVRQSPAYSLTRDAFSLVVMGFTGKKALAWKVKYIEAFNAMEAELLKKAKPSPRQRRPRKALPAPEQLALPTPAKDKFEAYLEEVEAFRVRTQQERERLFHTALDLVDVYKTGGALSRALFSVISDWLDKTALSPTSIFDSCLTPYAPILIVRELERKLPSMLDFLPGKKR